jgi:hypothetical protein
MLVLRILAGFFFLCAVIALMTDVTRAMNGASFVMTSLAAHWRQLSPQSLVAAQKYVASVHPLIWDPAFIKLLMLPAWFLFAAIGLVCAHLGRRQRRVNIFIN